MTESELWSPSSVERLSVQPVEPKAKMALVPPPSSTAPTSPPEPPQTRVETPSPRSFPPPATLLAVFKAISMVLAVRFQLLLALIGAFAVTLLAMEQQSYIGLGILVAYCGLTVIPLILLAWPDRGKVS